MHSLYSLQLSCAVKFSVSIYAVISVRLLSTIRIIYNSVSICTDYDIYLCGKKRRTDAVQVALCPLFLTLIYLYTIGLSVWSVHVRIHSLRARTSVVSLVSLSLRSQKLSQTQIFMVTSYF